jgi:hypothetical protein
MAKFDGREITGEKGYQSRNSIEFKIEIITYTFFFSQLILPFFDPKMSIGGKMKVTGLIKIDCKT